MCPRGICCPSEVRTAHMAVATRIICPDPLQPQRTHRDFASKIRQQGEKCGTCWCIFTLQDDLPQCNGYYSPPFIREVTVVANLAEAPLSTSSEHMMLWGGTRTRLSQGKWGMETVWRLSRKTRMDGDDDNDTCFRNKTRTVPYDKHIN